MGRILIAGGGELSSAFRSALNALAAAGVQPRPGTKLLTRYAVVVVDDTATDDALDHLQKAGIKAQKDPT